SSTDFNSQLTSFVYDNRDRLDSVTYNDASVETSSYDNHGNRTGANDRSSSTQGWSFDNRHRLIQVIDAAANRIDYQYDVAGNKTQQTTTPAGGSAIVTTYAYDALNRLQSVTDSSNQVTSYAYDANGNRASVTYPNGNVTSYVYDVNNRLTGQTTEDSLSTVIADYQYTLDPSGHRLQIDELGRGTSYTYDASYKLLSEAITDAVNGNHNASYLYDNVGNRTDSTINGVQTLYTYDDNDRLLQQGGEVFTYDNNGNTLSKTIDGFQSTYGYDAKNLVSSALINNGGVVTNAGYQYDVDGIRIQKTEDSNTVDYLIDPNHDNAQVIRETDSTSLINIDYLYGDDLIRQSQSATGDRYYLYDGLGSTRLLSDGTGAVTDTYDYEAFGSVLNQTGATENSYRFTGEQYDSALDNYYLRARFYDPNSVRFTQMDSWRGKSCEPTSQNKYIYAHSNPTSFIDPSGHNVFSLSNVVTAVGVAGILSAASTAIINRSSQTSSSSLALPTFDISSSKLVVATIYFAYIAQQNVLSLSTDNNMYMAGGSSSEAAERQADYEAYKYGPCDPGNQIPPPNLSPCEAAKWKLNVVKKCLQMRQDWDDKWDPGRHAVEIRNNHNRIRNIEKIIKRVCK
ncbi:MAG: RHS repeat-associated core domain-containing protein, partial [Halieaceae bacterium]|nr:RHS repeat-associated core domain-containing protein [Halieaceae bacterium]